MGGAFFDWLTGSHTRTLLINKVGDVSTSVLVCQSKLEVIDVVI